MTSYSGAPVVTIDGTVVTVPDFPGTSDDIGQRSTMRFTVLDTAGALALQPGMAVSITDAVGTLVWAGWIATATLQPISHTLGAYGWAVQCVDNVALADKRIAAATYTSQTAGYIVRDLVTQYLAAEGVYYVKNLLSANQSDVSTNTTGFSGNGVGTITLTRDTTQHSSGSASLKVQFDGTGGGFQAVEAPLASTVYRAGQTVALSCYVRGSGTVRLFLRQDSPAATIGTGVPITLTSTWTRYSVTVTLPNPLVATNYGLAVDDGGVPQAITFWLDQLQIEPNTTATAWEVGGTSTVQNGPTLTSYLINYEPVSQHIDKLATLASFYWNIDKYRRLTFATYALVAAPFTFDGSQADDPDGSSLMSMQYAAPLYRNGQYVLGITETTVTQTETRKGDGTTTVFTVSYPLHSAPTITVNAVSKTAGIKGVDTGKDWYWNKGDNTISQDSGGTKLTSSDTWQIQYVGEFSTLTYSEDSGAISDRASVEGGTTSGKVQQATTDTTLVTSAQGFQLAAALLAKYATSGAILTFLTRTGSGELAAGQLLSVSLPAAPWNVTDDFLIQSVLTVHDGFEWRQRVTALSGPVNDTWVNFWQRIAATVGIINTATAGTSQTLALLEAASLGVGVALSGTATVITYDLPSPTRYPSPSRYLGTAGTPVAITWTKTTAGLNALRDVLSGADASLKGAYLAWGTGTQGTPASATALAAESGRKALANYVNGGAGAVTLEYVLGPQDANGVAITEVGIFGGPAASGTAGSGILLAYGAYSHTKQNTESINIQPTFTFS